MDKIKQISLQIWQHLANETGNKFDTRYNVKSWFRSEKNASVHFYYNKLSGEYWYKDFAGESMDCIKAWTIVYNVDNKTAIKQIANYFSIRNDNSQPPKMQYIPPPPPPPPQIVILPQTELTASCNPTYYPDNNLFIWLVSLFGIEQATNGICTYHVGTSNKLAVGNGATAFWYVDYNNNVRYCSVIQYNPTTGKRLRSDNVPPVAQPQHHKGKGLTKCFFGEHLLELYPTKKVAIVESEKTAIVCNIVMPQFIWLASGGASCVSGNKATYLKGRNVILVSDYDQQGREAYSKAAQKLINLGVSCQVKDLFPDKDDKSDICDHIITKILNIKKQEHATIFN